MHPRLSPAGSSPRRCSSSQSGSGTDSVDGHQIRWWGYHSSCRWKDHDWTCEWISLMHYVGYLMQTGVLAVRRNHVLLSFHFNTDLESDGTRYCRLVRSFICCTRQRCKAALTWLDINWKSLSSPAQTAIIPENPVILPSLLTNSAAKSFLIILDDEGSRKSQQI